MSGRLRFAGGARCHAIAVDSEPATDPKPQNFRIDLNLATCGECQRAEYACTCDGH